MGREENNLSRLIKESMYIRVNGPSLNKNIGKMSKETVSKMAQMKVKTGIEKTGKRIDG